MDISISKIIRKSTSIGFTINVSRAIRGGFVIRWVNLEKKITVPLQKYVKIYNRLELEAILNSDYILDYELEQREL
jgi:hypothetical protein